MEVSLPSLVLDGWQMPASPDEVVLAALMLLKRRKVRAELDGLTQHGPATLQRPAKKVCKEQCSD